MQEHCTFVPLLFSTTSRCLSALPFLLLPSRNISRHTSLTWPFPQRQPHASWSVDVIDLLHWFCCWTPIRLSRHWNWLCQGYRRHGNLIDWLIDFCICHNQQTPAWGSRWGGGVKGLRWTPPPQFHTTINAFSSHQNPSTYFIKTCLNPTFLKSWLGTLPHCLHNGKRE